MRTVVIIGGIILAGATTIAIMMSERNETAVPVSQGQGITPLPDSNGKTAKLNPAHGMPEHRCDLAVGAPLTTASGSAVPVAAPQQKALPAPIGMKLNPAHGQPGHRCDLQVGASLN